MTDIGILQIDPSEWKRYKTIRLEALQQNPEAFGDSYSKAIMQSDEQWQERPKDRDTIILIATNNAFPVGMIGIHKEQEKSLQIAHLWGMYVNKDYRGLGIGKKLLQKAIEKANQLEGVALVRLMVNEDQHTAIGLYEQVGFTKTGTKEWVLGDGKNHELYVMDMEV